MSRFLRFFRRSQSGETSIELVILALGIALAILSAIQPFGENTNTAFDVWNVMR
jgi:Flp pilus assembly pilin Flp